jgi:hypothetical protein
VKGGLFANKYHGVIQCDVSEASLNEWIDYATCVGDKHPLGDEVEPRAPRGARGIELCALVGSEYNESMYCEPRKLIQWIFAIYNVKSIGLTAIDIANKYQNYDIAEYLIIICGIPLNVIRERYPEIADYIENSNCLVKSALKLN